MTARVIGSVSQTRLRRADQDATALLAPQDVVLRRLAQPVEIGGVELQVAPLAPASVQSGGTDTARGGADLLVEREQVVREASGQLRPLLRRLVDVGVDLGERRVASLRGLLERAQRLLTFVPQLLQAGLHELALLHDLELDVLELALTSPQRLDLGL